MNNDQYIGQLIGWENNRYIGIVMRKTSWSTRAGNRYLVRWLFAPYVMGDTEKEYLEESICSYRECFLKDNK